VIERPILELALPAVVNHWPIIELPANGRDIGRALVAAA